MKLHQLETPALYLDLDAFNRNQKKMLNNLRKYGLQMLPHYKSTKCTTIAHMQILAGAIGICCAKTDEAWDLAHAGIENILIANQVIDKDKILRVASIAKFCNLTICVDDKKNISDLSEVTTFQNTIINCLVECNVGANRCGVNSKEEALSLAKQIIESPGLNFVGIQAYAGHLSHQSDYDQRKSESDKVEKYLSDLIAYFEVNQIPVDRVSGVSTGTVDFINSETVYTEVQVGSYSYMDVSYGKLNLDYENSLFVLSTVMKVNEDFIILDTGRKSISVDQAMPQIKGIVSEEIKVSEEHTKIPTSVFKSIVGDKVSLIPGHGCTTMNLHDHIYFIRDSKVVDRVQINSRGRSL